MNEKPNIFGWRLNEIKSFLENLNAPAYAASQICRWMYGKSVYDFSAMTDLSAGLRAVLGESARIAFPGPVKVTESSDGTKKYLFMASEGKYVEAAMIPDEDRKTLCVSSQSGCKMGCLFCMTGKQGFQGQLSSAQILGQIAGIPEFRQLTNFVFMGMGEPLDNLDEVLRTLDVMTSDWGYGYSPSRITVSTIGLRLPLERFMESTQCHLAISLHSPFDDERRSLMPIQNAQPFKEILSYLESLDLPRRRRISIEYICFDGINDTPRHAKELVRVLSRLKCRINLIPYHPVPGLAYKGSPRPAMENFRAILEEKGFICTIRKSRGLDIQAACGLLSTKEMTKAAEKADY